MGHSSSKQASSDTTDSASSEAKLSESAASSTNSTASTGIAAIQASSSSSDSTTLDSIKTADEGEGTVPGDSTQNVTTDATSITTDTTTTTTEVTTDPGTTTTSTTTAKVDTTAEPSKPTTKATAPTSTHHRTEGINADVKNSGETTSHSSAPTGTANAKNVGAEPDAATTSPFTLSSPVLSTSVDSEGQTYIVTPSSITLLSTSTGSDGTSVYALPSLVNATIPIDQPSYTEVAANPTGASGGISDSNNDTKSTSFMENTSAKAGVFSALGIAFVAIVFAGFLLWRRRHRRQASLKWYDHKTPPEDPFADARDSVSPNMAFVRRSIDPDRSSGWSVPGTVSQRNTISDAPLVSADPFNPDAGNSHNVNLQSGRSTPSAYPPSVYDSSEHHSSEGHDAPLSQNLELPLPLVPLPAATAPPPRPARSILRETLSKPLAYLDPSRSSSPSGTSDPSSPVTPTISPFADPKTAPIIVRGPGEMYDIEENEISSIEELSRRINRRPTLLGARVRPSRSPPPGLRGFSSSNNSSDEYSS